jgi:hypothetical protein
MALSMRLDLQGSIFNGFQFSCLNDRQLTASRREMSSALLLFCSEVEDEMSSKTAEGKIQF